MNTTNTGNPFMPTPEQLDKIMKQPDPVEYYERKKPKPNENIDIFQYISEGATVLLRAFPGITKTYVKSRDDIGNIVQKEIPKQKPFSRIRKKFKN